MTEYISGNVFVRPNVLQRIGDITPGHEHNFDHTMYVTKGGARVTRKSLGGEPVAINVLAGSHCLVSAGVRHQIRSIGNTPAVHRAHDVARDLAMLRRVCDGMADIPARAILDDTLLLLAAANAADMADATETEYACIYSHRTAQGAVSEVNTGWPMGYI